jgi:biopolymer transport protein ExbD
MGAKLAGGGGKKKGFAANSEPNVIPFIDIMLVLLIIFMVASPRPTVDIKVDLPPPNAINNPQQQQDRPTFVFLDDTGGVLTYSIGVEPVTLETMENRLFEAARINNPTKAGDLQALYGEAKIFVKADQETAYNNVINMMNVIDQAGFQSVSLVAEEAQF